MSLTARVAVHLPYLRRYARAVTGSQTSGDAYVAAVLEALIADISIFPATGDDRARQERVHQCHRGSRAVEPLGTRQRLGDALGCVLVEVEGRRAEREIEIDERGVDMGVLGERPGEVVGNRGGPHAALGADEGNALE